MNLKEACCKVAAKALGEPGTIVECMFNHKGLGKVSLNVGEKYQVVTKSFWEGCTLLSIKYHGDMLPTRFRKAK